MNQTPTSPKAKALAAQKITDRQAVKQLHDYYRNRLTSAWRDEAFFSWVEITLREVNKEERERERKSKTKK